MKCQREFRIVLTPFCNYRCFFCHGEGLLNTNRDFRFTPEDYQFIMEVAHRNWGWNTATLTGGEPLLSPIFAETCKLLAKKGIRLTVVTNGSLLASPKKTLAHVGQVNVSLHTLDPMKYQRITGLDYSLSSLLHTLIQTRLQLPEIKIHLNCTIIRGYNDNLEAMSEILGFAQQIKAQAKFIDLASSNPSLVVKVEEIESLLLQLGFEVSSRDTWQTELKRKSASNGSEVALITRCGFSTLHRDLEIRNLILNPNGTVTLGHPDSSHSLDILREVYTRDEATLVQRLKIFFPQITQ